MQTAGIRSFHVYLGLYSYEITGSTDIGGPVKMGQKSRTKEKAVACGRRWMQRQKEEAHSLPTGTQRATQRLLARACNSPAKNKACSCLRSIFRRIVRLFIRCYARGNYCVCCILIFTSLTSQLRNCSHMSFFETFGSESPVGGGPTRRRV